MNDGHPPTWLAGWLAVAGYRDGVRGRESCDRAHDWMGAADGFLYLY